MRHRLPAVLAVLGLIAASACSDDPVASGPGTEAVFVVPQSLDALAGATFFDHPFPSDLRRQPDGKVRFTGWPNPFANDIITTYETAATSVLEGFSPAAPVYVRFREAIDPASLPRDPIAAADPTSTVQLVDVDPRSPTRGRRQLVQTHFQEAGGEESYWAPNTLAVMPILGRPLRPRTQYALVVTRGLRARAGGAVRPSPDLEVVLDRGAVSERTARARELHAPAVRELANAGIPAANIAHLAVFTTDDPTRELFAVADAVAQESAPEPKGWTAKESLPDFDVYEGLYGPSPDYQAGTPPFAETADGGGFAFEGGRPKIQRTFEARFALAVPSATRCPRPPAGYPIVLYAHGTGGDYRSFVDDGTAQSLAGRCLASIGTDQIFHGTRPSAPAGPQAESEVQLLFFNFGNPLAGRTNNRQAAIDLVQEARLFTTTRAAVPAAVSRTGSPILFDADRVLFFGHSQGGLNGPLFLAANDAARGGVLSGAGSVLAVALLEKTKPVDVASFVRVLLGLASEDRARELNVFHPAIALAQSLVDAADPVHYGAFITTTPRTGFSPKSVFQTEGIAADGSGDTYSPPRGIEALAVSMGLPRLVPGTRPIAETRWAGLLDLALPPEGVTGNLGNGAATGALAQFAPAPGRDGHFVVFDVPAARAQAASFCAELAVSPKGRLVPP